MCPICLTVAVTAAGSSTATGGLLAWLTRIRWPRRLHFSPGAPAPQQPTRGGLS